jgi:hypothetical protein
MSGLFAYRALYEHFFALRSHDLDLAITNAFGATRRVKRDGLSVRFVSWTRPSVSTYTAPISYAFVLQSDGGVVVGLDGGFFEEATTKAFFRESGIAQSGDWTTPQSITQAEVMATFPGVRRWWNVRAALAIPIVVVMLAPGVLMLLVQH